MHRLRTIFVIRNTPPQRSGLGETDQVLLALQKHIPPLTLFIKPGLIHRLVLRYRVYPTALFYRWGEIYSERGSDFSKTMKDKGQVVWV